MEGKKTGATDPRTDGLKDTLIEYWLLNRVSEAEAVGCGCGFQIGRWDSY